MADQFAIVTGASTGIGFELASIAAEQGYDLLVAADEALISSAAADFRRHGVEVRSVEADLATIDGVDTLLAAIGGRKVDVLCANAGRGLGHAFLEQEVHDWRRVVDTNITGTLYLLQKILAEMVAGDNGKVLVTGSIAGYMDCLLSLCRSPQPYQRSPMCILEAIPDSSSPTELTENDGLKKIECRP